jgi:hypothetical protein
VLEVLFSWLNGLGGGYFSSAWGAYCGIPSDSQA